MTFAAAFLLVAAAAQAAPVDTPDEPDRGAQIETAQVTVTILRPAVLKSGSLLMAQGSTTPHSQRQSRDGRVTYEFE
jgi:hypothetical protein